MSIMESSLSRSAYRIDFRYYLLVHAWVSMVKASERILRVEKSSQIPHVSIFYSSHIIRSEVLSTWNWILTALRIRIPSPSSSAYGKVAYSKQAYRDSILLSRPKRALLPLMQNTLSRRAGREKWLEYFKLKLNYEQASSSFPFKSLCPSVWFIL